MINQQTEVLWEQFSSRLQHFIAGKISDPFAAEDILQDVFLKIHHNINHLKEGKKLESWVYQITRNTIIDHYRKKRLPQSPMPENLPVFDTDTESAHFRIAGNLRNMVSLLPEKYKEALLLTDFNGMSQVELAKKLNISVSGAKSRVQRARKMLKELLLQCCHFEFDRRGTIIDYHRSDTCNCCQTSKAAC